MSKKIQKRKLDDSNNDPDSDEEILNFLNEKKKLKSEDIENLNERKKSEPETDEKNKEKCTVVTENKVNKNEKESSGILSTKPINTSQTTSNLKQSKLSFFKVSKQPDDWLIEDFLFDKEWKNLLKEEFDKKYFIEINRQIKDGYKKDINRPPKELVFNALNSTKLSEVNLFILIIVMMICF